ncbi:hypothetical protein PENTCL1PPCAC_441, partial [Pristionchus entomophagus]
SRVWSAFKYIRDVIRRLCRSKKMIGVNADEEEKDTDIPLSLNPVVPPFDNLTIDEESRDYFPILALPKHLLDIVFSFLPIEDRLSLAGVNKSLNTIESESKYYVERLAIFKGIEAPIPSALERDLTN